MTSDADRFWDEVAPRLRRDEGLSPLTPEEAEAELEAAPEVLLSEDQIAAALQAATSGELATWTPKPNLDWTNDTDVASVQDEALQLNRNRGEEDPETDEMIDQLREGALGDDEPQTDDDSTGLEDGEESPGQGG